MNDLTKYEIVKMAREAGYRADAKMHDHDYDLFLNFYTLCRAPLVAEVERLEQWHAEMADNRNAIASERDTLKAELARVRAGKPVAYIAWKNDKPCYEGDDAICEDAVWPVDSDDYRTSMPVFTAPQPAAQEPTSAVPVVEQLVEASTMLLSYTIACEGLLNAKPAGQIDIARDAIEAGKKFIKENGKCY